MAKAVRLICNEIRGGQRLQQSIQRQQVVTAQGLLLPFKLAQRHATLKHQVANTRSPQGTQMGAATEYLSDIRGQHTNVSSLAAGNAQTQNIALQPHDLDGVDCYVTCLTRNLDTLPGQLVKWPTVPLQCGMHRRNLLDGAGELRQHALDVGKRYVNRSWRTKHLSLGIARISHDTQLEVSLIGFVRIEQVGRELGSFPKAQGQQAGSHRVQCPGMPSLRGGEEPTRLLQGVIRGHP